LLFVGALALAGSTAFLTWWTTTLTGLPDIGDPFDVAAFTDSPVPDSENAFVLYKQAVDRLAGEPSDMTYNWATAGTVERAWLDKNREAMELWRRGSERPESLYIPIKSLSISTQLRVAQDMRQFPRLAGLEAGRLEAEGDLEGAWRWYRAIFRSSRHLGRKATIIERVIGSQLHDQACRQLTRWANDPRATPTLIRQALVAAISDYEMTRPLSDNVKVEYLVFLPTYNDPDQVWKCLNDQNVVGTGKPAWFARDLNLFRLSKGLKGEPERSRRVARLIFANLLATCDLPPERRPPIACSLPHPDPTAKYSLVDLCSLDDSAPASARALPPEKILQWFHTTLFASQLLPALSPIIKAIDRERPTQANLVITLANRLYEIERGRPPETVEELIGPYLKSLPEGYKPPQ
jgi:hypothetical protein